MGSSSKHYHKHKHRQREVKKNLLFISGRSHPKLADDIAKELDVEIDNPEIYDFANGEIYVQISKRVRGCEVFVFQTFSENVNKQIIELLLMIDALKRASAHTINVVIPYFPYARQDKKHRSREPISAKLISDLLMSAGTHRIITIDLHSPQIQGFLNIPVDHIDAASMLINYIRKTNDVSNLAIVSPDPGRIKVATSWSKVLGGVPLGFINKMRDISKPNSTKSGTIVGDFKGRDCILTDDIIDTAGTICDATTALMENGAKSVSIVATHAILSGKAVSLLHNSLAKEVIITDTVPIPKHKRFPKLRVLSAAPLIAPTMSAVFRGESVGKVMADGIDKFKIV